MTSLPEEEFPIKSVDDIKLNASDREICNDEILAINDEWINRQLGPGHSSHASISEGKMSGISERYTFSQYIVDPIKYRFRKVVRIVSLVFRFIKNLRFRISRTPIVTSSVSTDVVPTQFQSTTLDRYLVTQNVEVFPFLCRKGLVVVIKDEDLVSSLNYYFQKATNEIKHFLPLKAYEHISRERDGIMYYTGRILPTQQLIGRTSLADVCIDLTASTFCVPLTNCPHWHMR